MTDLLDVIPDFPSAKYQYIISGLETHLITTSDLLALDAVEVARRAHLPVLELKLFVTDVITHLHESYGLAGPHGEPIGHGDSHDDTDRKAFLGFEAGIDYVVSRSLISTLDENLDAVLNGGLATRYVTEVTGESGVGKTQFLMTLLLSAQLPAPMGLAKGTIYISTEHALPTQRLQYILKSNPKLKNHPSPPTLNQILSIQIPDLESQDHILTYQLPVVIQSRNIGLVVIDSIAANYRAEVKTDKSNDSEKSQAKALAARAVDLIKTGALLQSLAQRYDCAIVVANQVSDRFQQQIMQTQPPASQKTVSQYGRSEEDRQSPEDAAGRSLAIQGPTTTLPRSSPLSNISSSPLQTQSWSVNKYAGPPSPSLLDPRLTLDHQMRFFTGWGDSASDYQKSLKTPALGLTWTNQIACRIVISRESSAEHHGSGPGTDIEHGRSHNTPSIPESEPGGADWSKKRWRRWMKVVFSAWTPGVEEDDKGIEFEIWDGGLRSVGR